MATVGIQGPFEIEACRLYLIWLMATEPYSQLQGKGTYIHCYMRTTPDSLQCPSQLFNSEWPVATDIRSGLY